MGKHDALFEPMTLKNVELKNRIAMAPMNVCFTGPNHVVSKQQTAYYAARAMGGTGLIVIEAVGGTDHETVKTYEAHNNLMLVYPYQAADHSELVETIHTHGAKVICQIAPGAGRQGSSEYSGIQPVAPSPIPWAPQEEMMPRGVKLEDMAQMMGLLGGSSTLVPETPRELRKDEIAVLAEDMGKSARLARIAGYDGVELHAPHGYLLHEFLSPRSNKRDDEYGGSLENRARFMCECISHMRQALGDEYLLTVRISADEHQEDGFHVEDTIEFAKLAIQAGADGIHLSDGSYESMRYFLPDTDGQVVDESGIIKAGIKEGMGKDYPVICPSVHDPDLAAETVAAGKADIISQGRALIADPEWPNKVREGRVKDIVRCARCNKGCIQRFVLGLPSRCVVNPEMGQEQYIEKYNTRPLLPLKQRVWKIPKEIQ
ncbi:MAG: NADH:flavin oxidoreductase [Actinobacteria bacterium]|nr:MAG: NADH:flavin oxidoreductase [Actinomycetota bacterium]